MKEELARSEKLVRIFSAILAVFFIIVLVMIKIANPEFKLGLMLLICGIIIVFFLSIIIGYHFLQKRKNRDVVKEPGLTDKMPQPITLGQCHSLVKEILEDPKYAEYVPCPDSETCELWGKSLKSNIYTYIGSGIYSGDKYCVVINRHYPNELTSVLINPTKHEIHRAKNYCAKSPTDEPEFEETLRRNPLLGTEEVIRRPVKKEEESKEKKKEEL